MKKALLLSLFSLASLNTQQEKSIYDFVVKTIDGKEVSLSEYKGKVVLIVNTASKCGFTPQYEGLQNLYEKYDSQDFVILGFPANNFLWQEPGDNFAIKQFCLTNYGVSFPMFEKISVKGKDIEPLYYYLTDKKQVGEFGGQIGWNFTKFLINREGKVIKRFEPKVTPLSDDVVKAIEKAISE